MTSNVNDIFSSVRPMDELGLFLIIGKPKCGKTTMLAQLPNSVILDYEKGTNYVTHDNVLHIDLNTDWKRLIGNTNSFDFGIIDSITSMEFYLMRMVAKEYNEKVKPKDRVGSYEEIPYGAGYGLLRAKTDKHIKFIKSLFKRIICAGHSRPAQIRETKLILDPGLTGKNADLVLALMDGIAYVQKENEKRYLVFSNGLTDVSGSRLRIKDKILISEDNGVDIITHWNKVYPTTIKQIQQGEQV